MCAITKFLKACVTNGAIPRHPTEEMLKKGQGDEVVINGGMTVDKNGDVAVGRNLEVDGTLTVGGEPITPGGGGTTFYKHSILLSPDDTEEQVIAFDFVNTSSTPIALPTKSGDFVYTGLVFVLDRHVGESDRYRRYIGDSFYFHRGHGENNFGVGGTDGLRGIYTERDTITDKTTFVPATDEVPIMEMTDTVTPYEAN